MGKDIQALSLHLGSDLLARAVLLRDIRLGEIEDLLVDSAGRRLLGFVVLCGDGARRMLPLAATHVEDGVVRVGSALVLMEDGFYRDRTRTFTGLVRTPVRRGAKAVGTLTDLRFDEAGKVRALGVEGLGEVSVSDGLTIDPEARKHAV